jgi:hypothetical protein
MNWQKAVCVLAEIPRQTAVTDFWRTDSSCRFFFCPVVTGKRGIIEIMNHERWNFNAYSFESVLDYSEVTK